MIPLLQEIEAAASRCYPELSGRVEVRSGRVERRSAAVLRHYRVSSGSTVHRLLLKQATAAPGPGYNDAVEALTREFHLLQQIEEHVAACRDPRFGAVLPLAFLPEHSAFLVEEASEPTLKWLLFRAMLAGGGNPLPRVQLHLRNAGAWLAMFHHMPVALALGPRWPTPQAMVHELGDSLAALALDREDGRRAQCWLEFLRSHAAAWFADCGRMVLGHGDFALRNLLAAPGGRITGFDTRARWRVPPLFDVATFLMELNLFLPRLLGERCGLASGSLRRCAAEFLAGYFGDAEIPYAALQGFCARAMLEKWLRNRAAMAQPLHGWRPRLRRLRRHLENRAIGRWMEEAACRELPRHSWARGVEFICFGF
jgi:hypothetical protein